MAVLASLRDAFVVGEVVRWCRSSLNHRLQAGKPPAWKIAILDVCPEAVDELSWGMGAAQPLWGCFYGDFYPGFLVSRATLGFVTKLR